MTKLIILRGLPGSGKSTWAKQYVKDHLTEAVRVNRDDLRMQINAGGQIKGTEKITYDARNALIELYLKQGKTVICDDTNLRASIVKDLAAMAAKYNAVVEVKDFVVHVEMCIARDAQRALTGGNYVGKNVIMDMYTKFFRKGVFPENPLLNNKPTDLPTITPYVADVALPPAFIFDIDGTLANHNGRSPYDYDQLSDDLVYDDVFQLMCDFIDLDYKIIIVSGRPDTYYHSTRQWLNEAFAEKFHCDIFVGDNIPLLMRPAEKATVKDYLIKYEIFDQQIRNNYNVKGVFDDRNQCVSLWRQIGLRCYQVAPGDF